MKRQVRRRERNRSKYRKRNLLIHGSSPTGLDLTDQVAKRTIEYINYILHLRLIIRLIEHVEV